MLLGLFQTYCGRCFSRFVSFSSRFKLKIQNWTQRNFQKINKFLIHWLKSKSSFNRLQKRCFFRIVRFHFFNRFYNLFESMLSNIKYFCRKISAISVAILWFIYVWNFRFHLIFLPLTIVTSIYISSMILSILSSLFSLSPSLFSLSSPPVSLLFFFFILSHVLLFSISS